MDLKSIGRLFALTFIGNRAVKADEHSSMRRAAVGVIAGQSFNEADPVEGLSKNTMRANHIDRPVELSEVECFRPTGVMINEAQQMLDTLKKMHFDELYSIDSQLAEFEQGVVEARRYIQQLRKDSV